MANQKLDINNSPNNRNIWKYNLTCSFKFLMCFFSSRTLEITEIAERLSE